MVPPPGSTGDEFPDFDKMTFEEQMAWLESLAKRQGARTEELTTAADVDVPVPENAKFDEPGYVPFEGSRSAREAKEGKSAAPMHEPEPPAEHPAPKPAPAESRSSVPAEPPQAAEWDAAETLDPMQWLDSLTAQSGDELGDLGGLFAAGPGAQESEDLGEFADLFSGLEGDAETPAPSLEIEPEPEPPVEAAAPGAETDQAFNDLLGGMDPMAWLESLAKRQGANTEEFTTSANLEIEVPKDAVIDEPGYVPFEGSRSARQMAKPVEPEPAPEPEPPVERPAEPAFEEAASPNLELAWENASDLDFESSLEFSEPVVLPDAEELVLPGELDDLLGGADPMAWLESLAKRQGAKTEEFTTQADLEVPEMPEDTVIDEPGYVPYSAFDIRPPSSAEPVEPVRARVEPPPPAPEPEPVEEFEALDDSLSWLEDLAAEPAEGLSGYLAFEDEQAEPAVEEVTVEPEPPAPVARASVTDPLGGMTDEDVAYAQARGQLTGEQELAWLKRQAAKLAETRESEHWAESESESIAPAEAVTELPPWLQEMRPVEDQEAAAPSSLLDEFSLISEPSDVSDWLKETAPEGETGLPDMLSSTAELSLDEGVESLWAEEASEEAPALESELIPDSELAAFLRGELTPEEPDLLADALDAEYDRRIEGDESEPDWYTDAIAKAAAEAPPIQDTELQAPSQVEEVSAEPVLAEPVDMPGWLMETEGEAAAPSSVDADMPAWLQDEEAAASNMPAWLAEPTEELPPAVPAETMPDWLTEMERPLSAETSAVDWLQEEAPAAVQPAPEPVQPKVELPPAPKPVAPPASVVKPAPAPVAPVKHEIPAPVAKPAPAPLPAGELFEQYHSQLERDPNDHVSRLAFARALRGGQAVVPSLEQYETLIDSAQLLPDVADDLSSMVQDHPELPRARRLLGDVYMRQGMLQEALNAYRSALDQL